MPLVSCPDCGNQCSSLAPFCPKCGRPFKAGELQETVSAGGETEKPKDEKSEREREKAAAERAERIAKIPVTSRVVKPLGGGVAPAAATKFNATNPALNNSGAVGGCIAVVIIFVLMLLCCMSGKDRRSSSDYEPSTYSTGGGGGSNHQSTQPGSNANAPSSAPSNAGDSREDEITRRRYAECIRQREAAGLDTSPCSEWATER
jgi:hypothetical protein